MVAEGGEAVLVAPEWLEEHLHDPGLRVVEVDVSPAAYTKGHIEGAVLWNVYRDLKDADYRLVDKAAIERLVARSGIDAGSVVVFYGYAPAMGFWLMKLYGHAHVRLLDCSRATWEEQGRPWSAVEGKVSPTHYPLPSEDAAIRADHAAVEKAIATPTCSIVDVRTDLEYAGERFWPSGGMEDGGRPGHIPSAVHVPLDGMLDDRGGYRSPVDLRRIFSGIDLESNDEVVAYCTIGGRACTAWFALTYLLGRENIRVYDGSWAEWGRMPAKPVATAVGVA